MTRVLDIFFSFAGIIVLSPLMMVIAIWIKLTSKGPVFFSQRRVGKDAVEFSMLKFRTMRVNAEKEGLLTVGAADLRVTSAGYFLRKYKLDELPQLFNVIAGEMSIVGPRPEMKRYVDLYNSDQRIVLSVLPGITDIASVEFRNENELLAKQADPEAYYIKHIMPAKIEQNKKFIAEPTAANYLRIIFLTIRRLLFN
jgi:lipopolysaccharide/colanic/teichoic acid biosynthesis glycosyltransferase